MDAPQTAQEAASQLADLADELDDRRRTAFRLRKARDDAESLYKRERSKAYLVIDGPNAQEREAQMLLAPLTDQVVQEAHGIAARLFGDETDWRPDDVGDLRWLRDRGDGASEGAQAAAYDARDKVRAWVMVASMAKAERDDVMRGPDVGAAA